MFREHEGIIWQFVYILFAIVILALFARVWDISGKMWDIFATQDAASQNMKDYAAYVAYDDSIIRGQEMINLISGTKGDPFVIIMDGSGNVAVTSFNEVTCDMVLSIAECTTESRLAKLEEARIALHTLMSVHGSVRALSDTSWDHTNRTVTNANVQNWFLHRGGDSYKAYQTCLIFDGPGSSTVAGVLAVEV